VSEDQPKIALITGGSRGLGRNTAINLARRGVDIILTYNTNRAEAVSAMEEIAGLGRKVSALQLDTGAVSSFDGFVSAVRNALHENWRRDSFDFLVNNAGISSMAPFAEVTEADFDALVNVHLKGVFFLTQKLLPVIADGGRIVNLSTGLTRFTVGGLSAYAAVKGAVEVLTRYMAKELGPRGIAVNTVAPGATATDFGGGGMKDNPAAHAHMASMTVLGRVGFPDDIGPMIASLLSEDNRWVNAQRIEASGGAHL
jgi:NAD(P)-dependent dehydrogenase (short-subunit alcohol dehydrogenase family)